MFELIGQLTVGFIGLVTLLAGISCLGTIFRSKQRLENDVAYYRELYMKEHDKRINVETHLQNQFNVSFDEE